MGIGDKARLCRELLSEFRDRGLYAIESLADICSRLKLKREGIILVEMSDYEAGPFVLQYQAEQAAALTEILTRGAGALEGERQVSAAQAHAIGAGPRVPLYGLAVGFKHHSTGRPLNA
jgi:hypothetical protein